MIFISSQFVFFFIAVLALLSFAGNSGNRRMAVLLTANVVFYAWAGLSFLPLLFAVTAINYAAGRALTAEDERTKKRVLFTAVVGNLLLLAFFKYTEFFYSQSESLLQTLGIHTPLPGLFADMAFPIGISFYTFQGIAYCIDTYRNRDTQPVSFLYLLTFLSFFPTVLAGPIMRPAQFFPQLDAFLTQRNTPLTKIQEGAPLVPSASNNVFERASAYLLSGIFKKVVLASYLSEFVVRDPFQGPEGFSSWSLLMAVYGYAIQIYCDFSGYTDLALGIGLLLGFSLPKNFEAPYSALNLQEFWRRWHISLSTWLRDYLYIPLGGSKSGNRYLNLMITMLLGGLWHGGHSRFIIWGALHGAGLAWVHGLHRLTLRLFPQKERSYSPTCATLMRVGSWLITFHFVCLAWIFFRADDTHQAIEIIRRILYWNAEGAGFPSLAIPVILLGLAIQYMGQNIFTSFTQQMEKYSLAIQCLIFGMLSSLLFRMGPDGVLPFIYFQF